MINYVLQKNSKSPFIYLFIFILVPPNFVRLDKYHLIIH